MRMESPLKGWPPTRKLRGQTGFRVRARHLTAQRAKFTDIICGFINLGGVALSFLMFSIEPLANGWGLFTAIAVIIGLCTVTWRSRHVWGRSFFGKTTIFEFTPERIRIKGVIRFRNYDRTLPHEFNYEIHEKAEQEQDKEIETKQMAAREGKEELPKADKYFRQSFHIIFRYAGQRVDVASVFGKKQAEALLVRLQLLDQLMDAARGETGAPVLSEPSMQYGERPEAG